MARRWALTDVSHDLGTAAPANVLAEITVTGNGIVTLQGFVQDAWDLLALRRIAKRVAGVKRVVNDVELVLNDQ